MGSVRILGSIQAHHGTYFCNNIRIRVPFIGFQKLTTNCITQFLIL